MKISVCLTVFNEEKSVSKLLESLIKQTEKPDEIVIVDGGSADDTVRIIRHLQNKDRRIRLLVQNSSRAEGRNLSVELAKNELIAITDADCTADSKWLSKIREPFKHKEIDMVAGFYRMVANTSFERALSYFLAVTPKRFNSDFLPSTRSVAFRKSLWVRVGGFPESSDNSAEDTDFNYEVVKAGAGIGRAKEAIVYWKIPTNVKSAFKKFYDYAKWDAKKMIFWHPVQKFKSHNIKALLKVLRYLVFLVTLILAINNGLFLFIFFLEILIYSFWAFRKIFEEFQDIETALWGVPIQFLTDFAVIGGFFAGIIDKVIKLK